MNLNIKFESSLQLAKALSNIGYELDITQLTNGSQKGEYKARSTSDSTLVCQLRPSQDISIEGSRNPGFTPFIISSGQMIDHGQMVNDGTIFHFGQKLNQTSTIHYANTTMSAVLMPSNFINENSSEIVLERISQSNEIIPRGKAYQHLSKQIQLNLKTPKTSLDEWLLLIEDAFNHHKNDAKPCFIPEWPIASGVINAGRKSFNPERLRLKELCASLYVSKNKIYTTCYKIFGRSPIEVIRCIRLEQVKKLLEQPSLRDEMNLHSIYDMHTHYGFSNKRSFRHQYEVLFGEKPSDTLSRNRKQI